MFFWESVVLEGCGMGWMLELVWKFGIMKFMVEIRSWYFLEEGGFFYYCVLEDMWDGLVFLFIVLVVNVFNGYIC